jgi:hypothetical protein
VGRFVVLATVQRAWAGAVPKAGSRPAIHPVYAGACTEVRRVGLAMLNNEELLELESESDSGAAGSNGGGISTPSESVESETSSSSGECSALPGLAGWPKRLGMASWATRDRPGNSSLFHTTLRSTMMLLRPPLADGSHSFQPLKS